ncbi:cation efflux protein [Obelidium mucronatum]|nr:cation efflux protein [Obelidium mucronatum]
MDSGEDKTAIKKSLVAALILCFVFFLVELVAGWLCGSLAILSDAFHLLSDVAGFGLSLFAMRMSQRAATKAFSFGYKRFEVLAAVMSTLSIWIITVFLVIEAANRVLNPTPIDAPIMFWTALFGVGVNIALAFTLHSSDGGCSHSHGGGGGHGHTHPHGGSHEHAHSHGSNFCHGHSHTTNMDINVRAAAVHVISDLISSIGVMIASIILLLKPEWTIVDPLCTFFFSVLVFGSTWGLMSRCFAILLQGTPNSVQSLGDNAVESALCSIPFVKSVSKLTCGV